MSGWDPHLTPVLLCTLAWPPGMVSTQVLSPGVPLGWSYPPLPPSAATQLPLLWPSIPLEGKNQVWQHDIIPILVHLLKDKEEEVQASAAGALMYVTVTTKGEAACWLGVGAFGVGGHRSPLAS